MLKALIQLFSESFLKSKSDWVGGQVLPKSRISLDTSIKTYTAPSDGYIVLRDQGLPQRSSYLISGQYAEGVARGDNILFDFLMMTPVLKGVPVTIRYCGKDSVAQFIKNIGGGLERLSALLCKEVSCVA